MNRRSFAESLALAALAPALGLPIEAVRLDLAALAAGRPARDSEPDSGADAASLAATLMAIIRLEYGSRLSSGELAGVAEQIRAGLERADLIRKADRSLGA